MILILIICFYITCGIFAYAIAFAMFQRDRIFLENAKEEYRVDMSFSTFIGLAGPVGLLVALLFSGFAQHGLKFR